MCSHIHTLSLTHCSMRPAEMFTTSDWFITILFFCIQKWSYLDKKSLTSADGSTLTIKTRSAIKRPSGASRPRLYTGPSFTKPTSCRVGEDLKLEIKNHKLIMKLSLLMEYIRQPQHAFNSQEFYQQGAGTERGAGLWLVTPPRLTAPVNWGRQMRRRRRRRTIMMVMKI